LCPGLVTGVPTTAAIPISRKRARSRFSRCGGLFIHEVTSDMGVLSGPVPQTRFSPTSQLRAPWVYPVAAIRSMKVTPAGEVCSK
jgi:hypothetical protein